MNTELHPWLSTPEAMAAAKRAAQMPRNRMGVWSGIIGLDELESQALVILTECAGPKPQDVERTECAHCGESLEGMRRGAKFCGRSCKNKYAVGVQRGKEDTLAASTHAHIGSMWDWPADQMEAYARTQVGYVLLNYVRGCRYVIEVRASDALSNMNVAASETDEDPRELVVNYLEDHGVRVDGTETFSALAEAALSVRSHQLQAAA